MRHKVFGRKLSRSTNERRRLFMILIRDLVTHGKITTTLAKAKAIQPLVERVITQAKKPGNHAYRMVLKQLDEAAITKQLIRDAGTRFATRTSGYTRILKLGMRKGDASMMVSLSFVDPAIQVGEVVTKPKEQPVAPEVHKKPGVKSTKKVIKKKSTT